jgi:hypothetical protein
MGSRRLFFNPSTFCTTDNTRILSTTPVSFADYLTKEVGCRVIFKRPSN